MHELSVCQALVNQVVEIAQQNSAHTVQVITLHIGPLAGVEPALLVSAFPLAAAGTVAASAQLVIEPQPLRVHCQTCGADYGGNAQPFAVRDMRGLPYATHQRRRTAVGESGINHLKDYPCAIPAAAM